MSLLRFNSQDMDRFKDDMTHMWRRMREDWNLDTSKPQTHLHQIENGYLVECELPGVDPDTVDLEVDETSVSIRGTFPASPMEVDARAGESFDAVIGLPTEIDPETAHATYRHGLLSVSLHKAPGRRRRLPIETH